MKVKEKVFNIIQIGDKSNHISRAFDIFITVTILSNILVTRICDFSDAARGEQSVHVRRRIRRAVDLSHLTRRPLDPATEGYAAAIE